MMFSEAERAIYHCPLTNRDYDPLAIRRSLTVETRNGFGRLCDEARSEDPVVSAAAQITLTAAARRVFDWKPLVVLDATVWEALIAFTVYLRGKGPRVQTTPVSAPSSESPRAEPSVTKRTSP